MKTYKPSAPFNVAMVLLKPVYENVLGVQKKTFPSISDEKLFYGSFKTFGGTERDVNGAYSLENTAAIDCWYQPDITSDCHIVVCSTGMEYEIIGEPENINMQNQYMKFKVIGVKGGA